MNGKKVCIIGSGLAGLASALRLVKRGYEVEIIEKNPCAGGRLNQLCVDDFKFDLGPSFFTMTYEFDELANDCNISLPFEYSTLDPIFSVNFLEDRKTFNLYNDREKLNNQFGKLESNFLSKLDRYLKYGSALFNDTIDIAVRQNFNSLSHYIQALSKINKRHIPVLFTSYQNHVNRYFSSPELRQILSLSAYFLGNTPHKTNGVYSLLSHTEFVDDGYHYVHGGMYKIIEGIIEELKKENVSITYNSEIVNVQRKDKIVTGVIDKKGHKYDADTFIVNIDPLVFRNKILHKKNYMDKILDRKQWSMGMLTIYMGIDFKLNIESIHNYFVGKENIKHEMNNFRYYNLPEKPYYYVNIQSRYSDTAAPKGCEALMFVIPVPNLIYKQDWSDRDEIVSNIIKDFSNRIGLNLKNHIKTLKVMTPVDWQKKFNLYKGAALGLSHSMNQTGYLRPSNVDKEFKNLFYTGSSTQPGIGLPMAIISSRLTTERVIGSKIAPIYSK